MKFNHYVLTCLSMFHLIILIIQGIPWKTGTFFYKCLVIFKVKILSAYCMLFHQKSVDKVELNGFR